MKRVQVLVTVEVPDHVSDSAVIANIEDHVEEEIREGVWDNDDLTTYHWAVEQVEQWEKGWIPLNGRQVATMRKVERGASTVKFAMLVTGFILLALGCGHVILTVSADPVTSFDWVGLIIGLVAAMAGAVLLETADQIDAVRGEVPSGDTE